MTLYYDEESQRYLLFVEFEREETLIGIYWGTDDSAQALPLDELRRSVLFDMLLFPRPVNPNADDFTSEYRWTDPNGVVVTLRQLRLENYQVSADGTTATIVSR
jgi:hypothetical protein